MGKVPTPTYNDYEKSRRIRRSFIRLSYPIIKAHRNYCPDLGCGHGLVARYLPLSFANVLGTDPSSGMVAPGSIVNGHSNGTLRSCVQKDSCCCRLVVNFARLFPEMYKILRNNRTLPSGLYKYSSNQQHPNRFDPRKVRL